MVNMMVNMNERQSYALINAETRKIIKFGGKLQYYRLKQTARIERSKLQEELGIKIEIKKIKITSPAGGKPKIKDETL
ncbi:hypothetical protein LCGC14_2838920 [marine sediment metagenome]|uniref:Uncharacterized protein n=1 Tax=marine sediment metagenome TaxID=412755 RepID=A0A0F8YC17_9ZZZZ